MPGWESCDIRAAPIQVSYLGYAGTIGADFLDYIIADKTVLPFDQQPFYSEMIVHLPDCFRSTIRKRMIPAGTSSRRDAGLPPQGLVFCCFNNNYKITTGIRRVDAAAQQVDRPACCGCCDNIGARDNLRREATARGVDPARLSSRRAAGDWTTSCSAPAGRSLSRHAYLQCTYNRE